MFMTLVVVRTALRVCRVLVALVVVLVVSTAVFVGGRVRLGRRSGEDTRAKALVDRLRGSAPDQNRYRKCSQHLASRLAIGTEPQKDKPDGGLG